MKIEILADVDSVARRAAAIIANPNHNRILRNRLRILVSQRVWSAGSGASTFAFLIRGRKNPIPLFKLRTPDFTLFRIDVPNAAHCLDPLNAIHFMTQLLSQVTHVRVDAAIERAQFPA